MSGHRLLEDMHVALQSGNATIRDPGSNGTFVLNQKSGGIATIASGTRKLPDSQPLGSKFSVYATGAVTITNAAGTTVAVLAANQIAEFTAKTSTTWTANVQGVGGTPASAIMVTDAGSFLTAPNVEAALTEIASQLKPLTPISTTYNNTDATGTLAAAAIVGGIINRTGETTAYTDTTATGTEIQTAIGSNDGAGTSWLLLIRNTVAFTQTLAAGTDVTLAGLTKTPPNSVGVYLVECDGANVTVITGLGSIPQCRLPIAQFNTTAAASPVTPAAGILTGANEVFYEVTTDGAFGITTRTGTELFGDTPNCHIGFKYLLTIINRGNNTITITAGASVTIAENTIATLLTQTYLVEFTSATACTFTKVRTGTTPT